MAEEDPDKVLWRPKAETDGSDTPEGYLTELRSLFSRHFQSV